MVSESIINCNCYFLIRAPSKSTLLKGNPRNKIKKKRDTGVARGGAKGNPGG